MTLKRGKKIIAGVEITHPEKLLYPKDRISKGEVAEYYAAVAPLMLKEALNRPLTLVRCPSGGTRCFYQKHLNEDSTGVSTILVAEGEGKKEPYAILKNPSDIIKLAQLNTIEFHTWGSTAPKIELPDRVIFDLDPSPEISSADVVAMTKRLRAFLLDLKLKSFPRVTGGKGIHVVVPIKPKLDWDTVKDTSAAIAELFAESEPTITTVMSKKKRKGKVFIDYFRNGRGATAIANYSLRARVGAPVAVPIGWDELNNKLSFGGFNISNVLKRIGKVKDPWKEMYSITQTLPRF